MVDQNRFVCRCSTGFTLVETLLSIALLSAVVIGLFSFFTNAMTYTADNERRTVAINLARGAANYFEKNTNFASLQTYLQTQTRGFIKLEKTSCSNNDVRSLFFPGSQQGTLDPQQACAVQLAPTVNDVPYAVTVYIVRADREGWDAFLASPEFRSLPEQLQADVQSERTAVLSSQAGQYMAKLYTLVRFGERNRDITWVEGAIADETIR
ncbi:prepilin-type N-terminal cleavage/methylation domain-containing protein [Geobacillus sp. C56-T2]|uniref:type IV pilus modification PilV family protein n=1 Tax=Geobacillus sp. C56-T2 TaxID=600773 RepID=UPI00119D09DA|nr:prepilin-type N-terminal cleavage/methylation domain-containing protein [Geobacillus sp. C56-T2]NNV05547.1 type II secretion system protein [Geobacillus sp. MMMUD3]TWG31396.1 pilin/secretion family protein with methylation motif [Geobacillus sp. C56-T2]